MTIANIRQIVRDQGNGTSTLFAFPYPYFAASDILVRLWDQNAKAFVSPAPVLNGGGAYDYHLDGVADPVSGEFPSTNVIFNNAPLGNHMVLLRTQVPETQNASFIDGAKFPASAVNVGLDRVTALVQDLMNTVGQSLLFPDEDPGPFVLPPASMRANSLLGFDNAGNPEIYPVATPTDLDTDDDSGLGGGGAASVANYAALRALASPVVGTQYYVAGAWSAGDGGQGWFTCTNVNPGTDNNGIWITSATAGFYFTRNLQDTAVHVNWFGAIRNGATNPLSTKFGTLAAAQAVYPHATALTDEIDWCAWQAASNYVYNRDLIGGATTNWSVGDFLASGTYFHNRTVVFNHAAMRIRTPSYHGQSFGLLRGPGAGVQVPGKTGIISNITTGTVDAPAYTFDCYLFDELGNPPLGRLGNTTFTEGIHVDISGLEFQNFANPSITSGTPAQTNYASAIRIRNAGLSHIYGCVFSRAHWDAIFFTGPQVFSYVHDNDFQGVFRDAIHFAEVLNNFSTTMNVYNNEFTVVGRYDYVANLGGSVSPKPIFQNNNHEGTVASYFLQNPQWFIHGIPAPCCIVGAVSTGGGAKWERFETIIDGGNNYYAEMVLIGTVFFQIEDTEMHNLFLSAHSDGTPRTAAATTYLNTYGFVDVTDTRNYNCASVGHAQNTTNEALKLRNVENLLKIWVVAGAGFDSSGSHHFSDLNSLQGVFSVTSFAGANAQQVSPRSTAVPTFLSMMGSGRQIIFHNCNFQDVNGFYTNANLNAQSMCGEYMANYNLPLSQWQANHAYGITLPDNTLACMVRPTVANENGFIFQATVAGMSGGAEPAWPTGGLGSTVADGGVTWKCVGLAYMTADVGNTGGGTPERMEFGSKIRNTSAGVFSVPPTTGRWAVGDKFYIHAPAAGGNIGQVCTGAGLPGTWKTFGAIAP